MRLRAAFRIALALCVLGTASAAAFAQTAIAPDDSAATAQHPELPPVTDADRQAAFPDVEGHAAHDNAVNYLVLFDRLEWQAEARAGGLSWDNRTWVGRDRNRLWLRSEGQTDRGRVGDADAHVLYGRAIARWWDVVAGVRQDVRPGSPQTWAAVGVQGLAPYWFEVEATAYLGAGGQTAARVEVEYESRFTNRLIVQPRLEVNLYSKSDPGRGREAGLGVAEAGFRIRYEFRREVAPYAGVVWNRRFGDGGEFVEGVGERARAVRFLTGIRLWF